MEPINVLIVDDSAVVREILTSRLKAFREINVVASAHDPYEARSKIARNKIDVVTLDIEMPRMDGLTFLRYLMKHYPIPTIIVSSLTDKRNKASLTALELGAVDIVPKPGGPYSVEEVIDILVEKIMAAASVDMGKMKTQQQNNSQHDRVSYSSSILSKIRTTKQIIGVGASTGGTSALEILFKGFDKTFPPTACVIHMPEKFTATFADRLNQICQVNVKEAQNGEAMQQGTVYLAPGNRHLVIKQLGADRILKVVNGPYVHHQRPAVDVLFNSMAKDLGQNAVGVLLTGMGKDGAQGLLNMHNTGAYTICQDEASCIVFGMPKEAIELGAADEVVSLNKISLRLLNYFAKEKAKC
ncbi:MAG: chemotaxis response regulator protein-glutamate methylesterase [Spirochaetales bacterium]|nr:chemotaxis response regulator protein-glutamate methylesterase [Spirochaetales bacterium]